MILITNFLSTKTCVLKFSCSARRASDGHITFNKTTNLDSLQELPGQEVSNT